MKTIYRYVLTGAIVGYLALPALLFFGGIFFSFVYWEPFTFDEFNPFMDGETMRMSLLPAFGGALIGYLLGRSRVERGK